MCRLRRADAADWQAFFGAPAPPHWLGLIAEDDRMMLGFGGFYAGVDGRWWAMMVRAPGVSRTLTMQRAARLTLDIAREAGVSLMARADPRIGAAPAWLKRLGFSETDETVGDLKVWQWVPN